MNNKSKIKFVILFMMIITIGAVGFYFYKNIEAAKAPSSNDANAVNSSSQNTSESNSSSATPATDTSAAVPEKATVASPPKTTTPKVTETSSIVPPMDNFNGRITLNGFGNEPSKMKLTKDQYSDLVCSNGKNYPGFHTAVDLEVTPEERNKAVPVYSIADGIVRQASTVNGYGGLVVIEYKLNGQTYTAYFGHVDLKTVTVKAGSKVTKGQKVAELAPACSSANGNTRKHLHFGLHRGSSVVVSGYVTSKSALSAWVDPRTIIE